MTATLDLARIHRGSILKLTTPAWGCLHSPDGNGRVIRYPDYRIDLLRVDRVVRRQDRTCLYVRILEDDGHLQSNGGYCIDIETFLTNPRMKLERASLTDLKYKAFA